MFLQQPLLSSTALTFIIIQCCYGVWNLSISVFQPLREMLLFLLWGICNDYSWIHWLLGRMPSLEFLSYVIAFCAVHFLELPLCKRKERERESVTHRTASRVFDASDAFSPEDKRGKKAPELIIPTMLAIPLPPPPPVSSTSLYSLSLIWTQTP